MKLIRRFRVNIVLRVIVLLTTVFTLSLTWQGSASPITNFFLVIFIIGLVAELIYYVEKTTRDLSSFLHAIRHRDFSFRFPRDERGRPFTDLRDTFKLLIDSYQHLQIEKEANFQQLQYVLEHVSTGLICYDPQGNVELMNQAAKDLLERPHLSNINSLTKVDPNLLNSITALEDGKKDLVQFNTPRQSLQIALSVLTFKMQQEEYKLVSLQDIHSELDEKEIQTWQKLIRVLTHEIMNSVTPIISLTKVIRGMMVEEDGGKRDLDSLSPAEASDVVEGLSTIESRSKGLLHFVHAYRNLTRVQSLQIQETIAQDLIQRVESLLRPELTKRTIQFDVNCPAARIRLQVDPQLIEQVLINLIKNAMEAVEGKPGAIIRVNCRYDAVRGPSIQVSDNGGGIHSEYLDKIFIPFFTTKKKGSGIGLSLSRQIMRLHQGSIQVESQESHGTTFTLWF
ncbi:MAG: ATP-binding protein [Bacteroidota bacterium]